ncbi:V-type proton ATPase subunit G [Erysiphe necator]|nr:V-type proton ATPase subunit G [Erysiphe necator]
MIHTYEDRTKRVKEARDEAKKEIDTYKEKKESELRKYESEHSSGNKKAEEVANIEVAKKIVEIKELGNKGQDKVVQELLNAVYEATPIVPDRIKIVK